MEQNNPFLKKIFSFRSIVIFFAVLIFINLIFIDLWIIRNPKTVSIVEKLIPSPPSETQTAKTTEKENNTCPQSCITQINQALSSYKFPSPSPTISVPVQATTSTGAKEYYIPFGSGSNSSDDWQDVSGLQAYIDANTYGTIKSVIFEANVHVPTANETANVRLFNVTDKHPVWNSEVFFTGGGTPQFLTSKPITLDTGNKLYKVQMKTQLKFEAILDQARLHITIY